MDTLALQLVTVDLQNGERGVFIGVPLLSPHDGTPPSQVEEIWFSNVQKVPTSLTVEQLLQLVRRQYCHGVGPLQ